MVNIFWVLCFQNHLTTGKENKGISISHVHILCSSQCMCSVMAEGGCNDPFESDFFADMDILMRIFSRLHLLLHVTVPLLLQVLSLQSVLPPPPTGLPRHPHPTTGSAQAAVGDTGT